MAATFTLACGLVLQAALLTAYLALRDRPVLVAIAAQWRRSLFAGFMGAFASQFWFLAFAIATAASVRTLALVEVLFAQAISAFIFKQATSPREGVGMAMIVVGVIAADLVASDVSAGHSAPERSEVPERMRERETDTSRLAPPGYSFAARRSRERDRNDRGADAN